MPLGNMVAISQMIVWNVFSRIKFSYFDWNVIYVGNSRSNNNNTAGWDNVWHRMGDKPLSEQMLTRFTDAFMRH